MTVGNSLYYKQSDAIASKKQIAKAPLPLTVKTIPGMTGSSVKTKSIFSSNLTFYTKGTNSFGGGANSVGNSRAITRRT